MKIFFKISLFVLAAVLYSCEENLNPYGEFKEKFVLNCIIHGDTTYQVATITKSIGPGESGGINNNFVEDAYVRIWSGDKVGLFRDTTVFDSSENNEIKYYFAKDFKPNEKSEIEIQAILPNGRKLIAKSTVPEKVTILNDISDFNITSETDSLKIFWQTLEDRPVFSVRMRIGFYHLENNKFVSKSILVPQKFIEKDNKKYPIYPGLTDYPAFEIDLNTISETMRLISGDDVNKSDYAITNAVLEILLLDKELSKYYYTVNRAFDSYSIKLDETDYSNIQGGLGIFGVTIRNNWRMKFSREYVESFGYRAFF